ncbi:MAG: TIGR00270 family protein [Candidatus Terraquivivens tikiterensis]|uniref:TIGR00270 family protein n=1 Tax=Candidatus Terraquivivens tikiterensis TaxID=1980982 RepID=A0A2R7YA54_9ARCH|nr:MAG: TIGR00270 family protein [Candidatus Terraquivivens tikiterensis]
MSSDPPEKAERKKSSTSKKDIMPMECIDYVEDFHVRIKNARERMGLSQEELAAQLNEKVGLIRKIEQGEVKPPIELARKIEKFLKIQIIEEVEEDYPYGPFLSKPRPSGYTLGDVMRKLGMEERES